MPYRKPPHCGSTWHFQCCQCGHERQVHQDEEGVCKERRCDCVRFVLGAHYPVIEHVTVR